MANQIPTPPGYSASDIVPSPMATSPTGAIPPPPGYTAADIVPTQAPQPQPHDPNARFNSPVGTITGGTISATPQPTTYLGRFGQWAENVSNDIKNGTDNTGIGTVLKKMGNHGVYSGNSEALGDFMASLPLGLLKVGKGTTELAPQVIGGPKGRTVQGLKDVIGGGLQAAQIPSAFVAPEAGEVAANAAAKGTEALGEAVNTAKNVLRPDAEVKAQMVKDAVKRVLGNKANADTVNEAVSRIGDTKMFSTVENELKLVKPQIDADLVSANSELDKVLANSQARIQNAGTQVHKVFDDLIQNARKGVGDSSEAEKAINAVRDRILPKIGDGDLSVQEANNLKRTVGDEIKKFQPPEMLNSFAKNEQEAYRQAYFKLRDLVSKAEPLTTEINSRISKAIDLQTLLERKFPHLESPEAAQASYAGTRSQAAVSAAKKAAIKAGATVATGAGVGVGYNAIKHALGE